jgi:hypothetical protein
MPKSVKALNSRNRRIYFLMFSMPLLLVFSFNCYGDGRCTGKDEPLVCLKRHSEELYSTNHEVFWKILRSTSKKANACKNKNDMAEFLSIVQITRDGDVAEFFGDNIESLCLSKHEVLS